MGRWVAIAEVFDLSDGTACSIEVEGVEIALFRVDGRYYALEDLCTHADAALSMGHIEACTVACPLHGARFDLTTGAALDPPAYEPTRCFPVRVRGTRIEIEL